MVFFDLGLAHGLSLGHFDFVSPKIHLRIHFRHTGGVFFVSWTLLTLLMLHRPVKKDRTTRRYFSAEIPQQALLRKCDLRERHLRVAFSLSRRIQALMFVSDRKILFWTVAGFNLYKASSLPKKPGIGTYIMVFLASTRGAPPPRYLR